MKILVAIKRVQDYNVKVRPKSDGSDVDIEGIKMGINPFDENALEEALRLKEKELVSEITVVSIGDEKNQDVPKKNQTKEAKAKAKPRRNVKTKKVAKKS